MPMTSLTCTSRQARTQRLHWMQASRLTAMATWLRSGAGTASSRASGSGPASSFMRVDDLPEFGIRIVRDLASPADRSSSSSATILRAVLARSVCGLDLHAGRRRADAACGQHALALDLDHADAAIAVGAIAGLRRVAQMRQLDAEPARGAEDGFAVADVDLAVVDHEGLAVGRPCRPYRARMRTPACRRRHAAAAPLSWP